MMQTRMSGEWRAGRLRVLRSGPLLWAPRVWAPLIRLALLWAPLAAGPIGCGGDGTGPQVPVDPAAREAIERTPPPEDPGPRARLLPSDTLGEELPPRFKGISQLTAGDGSITLRWEPALDSETPAEELRYRVYLSPRRQDEAKYESAPARTTEPGVTGVRIDGLENGRALFVSVRAVDAAGNEDDNELEWSGIPNPVLFVDGGAPAHGNGTAPDAPLPDLASAISASIAWMQGANIHMAEGSYEEPTLLLFPGVHIYGGFPPGFTSEIPEPRLHPTVIRHSTPSALTDRSLEQFILVGGELVCGLDGLELDGGGQVPRGVTGEDCEFRISNCKVRSYVQKGIAIQSDTKPDSVAVGEISRCWVYDIRDGSAIELEGTLDIAVFGCGLFDNRKHGVEVLGLTATEEEKSRILIEGCRIYLNEDIGVLVKSSAHPEAASEDARIRVKVRSCEIANNADSGMSIDVGYPDRLGVNFRLRVEQCRIEGNGRRPTAGEAPPLYAGVHIDGDARGHFQLTRNQILGNQGHGVHLTGDTPVSFYQIQSCAILANGGSGVRLDSGGPDGAAGCGHLKIDHCHIAGNLGPAFSGSGPESWLRVESSMLHGNGAVASADRIDGCVAEEGQLQISGQDRDATLLLAEGAPWLETLPREIRVLETLPAGTGPTPASLAEVAAGSIVEWLDDGVPRQVLRDADGGVGRLEPPITPATVPRHGLPFLYLWGPPREGVPAETLVVEDYRAPPTSPLRRVPSPRGEPHHATPMGGFFGGWPGIDRGGAPPPRGLELSWIDPAPGMPISALDLEVAFSRELTRPEALGAVIRIDGEPLEEAERSIEVSEADPFRLRIRSPRPIEPGARVEVELLPSGPDGSDAIPHSFELRGARPIRIGEALPPPPAVGELVFIEGRPVQLSLDALANRGATIRLLTIDPPGGVLPANPGDGETAPLRAWRIEVVERGSGKVKEWPEPGQRLEAAGEEPSDGALRLRLPSLEAAGGYDLRISPPKIGLLDAAATLMVTE